MRTRGEEEKIVFEKFLEIAKKQGFSFSDDCKNKNDPLDFICFEDSTKEKVGFELKELAFEDQMKLKKNAQKAKKSVWGESRHNSSKLTGLAEKRINEAEQKVFRNGKIEYPVDLLLCMFIDHSLGFTQDWESAEEGIKTALNRSIGRKFRKIWLFDYSEEKLKNFP